MARKRKTSGRSIASARRLDELIEEAIVDAYDEQEQAIGFFTMIEENLALPFKTRMLGIEVSVVAIEVDNDGRAKAVCKNAGERQRIDIIDLPLPAPPPSGAEWIAAYRRWRNGG